MFNNKEDYENYLEEIEEVFEKMEQHKEDIKPLIREYFKILHDLGETPENFHEFGQHRSHIGIESITFEPYSVEVIFSVYEGCGESSYYERDIPIKYIIDENYRNNFKKEKEDEALEKKKAKEAEKAKLKKEREDREYQQFLTLKNKFENTKNAQEGDL